MAATIKRQLQLLVPNMCIFLDVDNLESIDELEAYVEASAMLLVLLGSPKYFYSANCLRELRAAKTHELPLVCVHDSDPTKHGGPLADLRAACSPEFSELVFGTPLVVWHRVHDFQLVSLAAIVEHFLRSSPPHAEVSLEVPGALAWAQIRFNASTPLYVSRHNPEASTVATRLHELHSNLLLVESPPVKAASITQWLLFLHKDMFSGEQGKQLETELLKALRNQITPVLVYSPEAGVFSDIMGATPIPLMKLGLYSPLAIEWHEGMHEGVSQKLLLKALGAQQVGVCSNPAGIAQWLPAKVLTRREDEQQLVSQGGRIISLPRHSETCGVAEVQMSSKA